MALEDAIQVQRQEQVAGQELQTLTELAQFSLKASAGRVSFQNATGDEGWMVGSA
jgi:hypothetical protein